MNKIFIAFIVGCVVGTFVLTLIAFACPPPSSLHADAGGPYIGWIGVPVNFDASNSWADNGIVSYVWDLDYDGLFGTEDNDCFGEPSDAVGINPEWIWNIPNDKNNPMYDIYLKVIDSEGNWTLGYTCVVISNHSPTADPGGPYEAKPKATIALDGTGSFDPDPGDYITLAWDLDNDGHFDDSDVNRPEFTVGSEIGKVYDICLKVTDSFGGSNILCTTVEIIAQPAKGKSGYPDYCFPVFSQGLKGYGPYSYYSPSYSPGIFGPLYFNLESYFCVDFHGFEPFYYTPYFHLPNYYNLLGSGKDLKNYYWCNTSWDLFGFGGTYYNYPYTEYGNYYFGF